MKNEPVILTKTDKDVTKREYYGDIIPVSLNRKSRRMLMKASKPKYYSKNARKQYIPSKVNSSIKVVYHEK